MEDNLVSCLDTLRKLGIAADESIQRAESRREYYLALLKASPFVIIPLSTSTIIAFEVYGNIGWFFSIAAGLVFFLGVISWLMTITLDNKLPDLRAKSESCRRNLLRRTALVEAEFLKYRPSTTFLYIENIAFEDQRIGDMTWRSFEEEFNPHLLKDMLLSDKSLVEVMRSMDDHGKKSMDNIRLYYTLAHEKIMEVDRQLAIDQSIQPASRMPSMIRALYYALSGTVNSLEELDQPRLRARLPNDVFHFLQLLYGKFDEKNPYPELLKNEKLRDLVAIAETNRVAALNNETTIRLAIQALIGNPTDAFSIGR